MRATLTLLLAAVLLAGCGYKGPLFLPKAKPEAQKPVAKAEPPKPAPAEIAKAPAQAEHPGLEIQWWHSMTGANNAGVNELAARFNASQKEYKIVPVYKGSYPESMTAAIAAFRAGNPPHILQVFEVGTATMMAAKGTIVPVAKVMTDAKEPFDPKAYLPTVTGYYSDPKGNMLSLPFNSSTALFYIDKNKFKAAGLPPVPPKTWKEVIAVAQKLKAAGQDCVYTTGWPSWVHIENFSAWHNVPIGTKQNGMGGLDTKFTINSPVHVKHIAMLAAQGELDEPIRLLERRAPQDRNDPSAKRLLADLYVRKAEKISTIDKSGAVMLLQKCLRVDPKNARATALMRQLIDESAAKAPAAAGPAAAAKNKVDKR